MIENIPASLWTKQDLNAYQIFDVRTPLEWEEGILCERYNIALITLVSVTTPKERVKKLVKHAKGFIYLLASIGITGTKSVEEAILQDKVKEIRSFTNLPIFVGFGIQNNQDVKRMRKVADGVIVGTSIVKCFKQGNLDIIMKDIEEIFKK